MNGGDNSVTAGFLSAGTLVAVNAAVGLATYKSKWLEGVVEGRPQLLIHNGRLDERVMRREKVTHHELLAALRQEGVLNVADVHAAILENNGRITVLRKAEPPVAP
jgi:uncharacterized membrane protein YcaP (DUF421 family)